MLIDVDDRSRHEIPPDYEAYPGGYDLDHLVGISVRDYRHPLWVSPDRDARNLLELIDRDDRQRIVGAIRHVAARAIITDDDPARFGSDRDRRHELMIRNAVDGNVSGDRGGAEQQ